MNKQELIDELAKYVKSYENAMDEHGQGRYGAYEVSLKLVKRLNESKITDEQAWNKVAEAYPESAQSLRNTLDNAVFGKTGEHQKPVVPKFVADYIEEYRGGGATLYEMMDSSEDEVYTWLFGNPRIETENERQLLFAQAYAVGYEVEKEPLYYVRLPYEVWDEEAAELKTEYLYLHYEITSDETRIFPTKERYWPFAVPLEAE